MISFDSCLKDETPILVVHKNMIINRGVSTHKKNGSFFAKDYNASEFIGEELCLMNHIRCSHYDLATLGSRFYHGTIPYEEVKKTFSPIMLVSPNFHKKDCSYRSAFHYGLNPEAEDYFEQLLSCANGEENREQLRKDLYNMIALDIYMGQTDRYCCYSNYQLEEDGYHHVRLAPLYDFEYSFQKLNEGEVCFGDLAHFETIEKARKFLLEHPDFREVLSPYLDVDLESVVRSSFAKRRLNVSEKALMDYCDFEEIQKEKIKRIVR